MTQQQKDAWTKENIRLAEITEIERKRKWAAYQREHRKNNPTRDAFLKRYYKTAKFIEHDKARQKLRQAIRSGKIQRGNCSICNKPNAHGHHKDYSKPLEVVWLCQKHHVEHHNKMPLNRY